MSNRVTILGNSAATPTSTRRQSGQYLQIAGHTLLVDCGEGTQNRMIRLGLSYQRISHIFVSHLHGDHFLGLFPLLNTMNLQNRTADITVVAPPGLKKVIDTLIAVTGVEFRFEIHFIDITEEVAMIALDHITVYPFLVEHRIPCFGFRFEETRNLRKLLPERCKELNIPYTDFDAIVNGEDWVAPDGRVIPNESLTTDPPDPISYVYITDTRYGTDWIEKARNATLLYHEATYLDNLVDKAHDRFHSTAKEAAIFAKEAGVKQLIIGHFSGKYKNLDEHLEEARSVFPNSDVARQDQVFEFK